MWRITSRRVIAVFALALIALLAPSTAAFAQYSDVATLVVSTPTTSPCSSITITGTNFLPNHEVTISADGVVLGTVMSDADGNFSYPYTVPCSAVAGVIEFEANDGTNVLTVNVSVLVDDPGGSSGGDLPRTNDPSSSGSSGGTLPRTGSSTTETLLRIGVLLIAGGGLVVVATRRRSSRTDA